ncbi:unnamed protein product, partial [Symbiodinium pilosum]
LCRLLIMCMVVLHTRLASWCCGFLAIRHGKVHRAAFNIGSLFGSGEEDTKLEVPKDVEAVVAGLKSSTENALNSRCSRLDVELPPSFELGVENKDRAKAWAAGEEKKVVLKEVARGDRELARIFVEMLSVIDGLVVVFRTPQLEKAAKKRWRLTAEEARQAKVISFTSSKKSAFAAEVSGPSQFLKKLEDLDCKCLVVVAPELDQLRTIADLSKDAGDQMGIILLNARIHGSKSRKARKLPPRLLEYLQKEFEPSYHVRFLKSKKWPDNSIIFRQICPDGEGPWIVAIQRELIGGSVVTNEILRADKEPSVEDISDAFARYEASDKEPSDAIVDFLRKDRES